ncbi:MAG TPA: hypothetical protein VFN50_01100 [Acidimicrobiales bacterium]|nr:hypothetical protein [Acidimicrobiales bacterium]
MRRKVFDILVSAGGLVVVVVLVVAGALLMWGSSFTNASVHNQLQPQQIFFPPKAAFVNAKPGTEVTPAMRPYLEQYAGQQVLTGPQAEAYADHFIADHLAAMPYGGVYSKVSAAARAATPGTPQALKLTQLEGTVFQGTTLRGLLLEAYGFWKLGQIAFFAAIASFILAFAMAVLVGFGFWHSRRVPENAELLTGRGMEEAA